MAGGGEILCMCVYYRCEQEEKARYRSAAGGVSQFGAIRRLLAKRTQAEINLVVK